MEILIKYAMQFVGIPYRWGGNSPLTGLDCSGLVQILLKSCGVAPPYDLTAQGLYDHFSKNGQWNAYKAGSLIFFGASAAHVTHVGMLLDEFRMIEAAGGDSTTLTPVDAAKRSAYVRVSHIGSRSDKVAVIRPNYSIIGLI